MNQNVTEQLFYHINTIPPYSSHEIMEVGSTYTFSRVSFNPFFNYYEVKPDPWSISGIDSLNLSSTQLGCFENFQQRAFGVANHYRVLARELLLEKVRCESFPSVPSRHSCIFLIESDIGIQNWKNQIISSGHPYQIVEVSATGNSMRVDSKNLPIGNEPISEWDLKALKYWGGELTNEPCIEVLLEGYVTAINILETNI